MNAQNLQRSVESAGQLELLVKDRDHKVGADRNPDLGLHRVGARAVVMFDSQVAFDPAEEQPDAPAKLVEHGHSNGGCDSKEASEPIKNARRKNFGLAHKLFESYFQKELKLA
jgi:hypothetical protein